jgi:hypothetical protein
MSEYSKEYTAPAPNLSQANVSSGSRPSRTLPTARAAHLVPPTLLLPLPPPLLDLLLLLVGLLLLSPLLLLLTMSAKLLL